MEYIVNDPHTQMERMRNYYKAELKIMQDAFYETSIYQQICYDLVNEGIITGIDLIQRKMKKEKEREAK